MIKAEHDLPGTEGVKGERVGEGCRGEKMTQTMYAHVNKRIKKMTTRHRVESFAVILAN
jgi:hypothetical protein